MTNIDPNPIGRPQVYEMEPISAPRTVKRTMSNSEVKTDQPGTAGSLGELAQIASNPNVRYEDQADYIEGGFGWAIVLCKPSLNMV
jgi:hypothetical protein